MSYDECYIRSVIRAVPDWPEPGVMFRDIAPLFQDPKALHCVIDAFSQRYIDADISHIAALDARGFLLGSILSYKLNLPLILIRKKGKLPGDTLTEEYQLEYGSACVEVHTDACKEGDKVLLIDDLIATGGSLLAASTLLRKLGAEITEAAAIIDLPFLHGSSKIQEAGIPVHTLIAY
ncbi:adenine phosphoribosyltransferase [Motiliproteus coralliicola]|uniref:Adenine phosphoribosyltransferase n=1 Tax=Motiliproteus coralliicola TaxID=2283196 RepID=A0A369WUQ8_9GAMM|nr:adenine phosphoribosyltransferase [Motiliproteus coralliicola]RDE24294.1 adenine phosphoribosyltransferase [Motiliproteus coralliicola]